MARVSPRSRRRPHVVQHARRIRPAGPRRAPLRARPSRDAAAAAGKEPPRLYLVQSSLYLPPGTGGMVMTQTRMQTMRDLDCCSPAQTRAPTSGPVFIPVQAGGRAGSAVGSPYASRRTIPACLLACLLAIAHNALHASRTLTFLASVMGPAPGAPAIATLRAAEANTGTLPPHTGGSGTCSRHPAGLGTCGACAGR